MNCEKTSPNYDGNLHRSEQKTLLPVTRPQKVRVGGVFRNFYLVPQNSSSKMSTAAFTLAKSIEINDLCIFWPFEVGVFL